MSRAELAMTGREVRRVLREAGVPLHAREIAHRCGRRCTIPFRELLGTLWLAGEITNRAGGYSLARRQAGEPA